MQMSGIITLTTDFGMSDPYAAVMKGVILSINPHARIVDISHMVGRGDILHASTLVSEAYGYFPPGTVHAAVVDPGVGSLRRPLLVVTPRHLFVGPDNGIFFPLVAGGQSSIPYHLTQRAFFGASVSHTFHGRDIFAPVAAHLSLGVPPRDLGEPVGDPVRLHIPAPRRIGSTLRGRVMKVDHFGNVITTIPETTLVPFMGDDLVEMRVGTLTAKGVCSTYSDVAVGSEAALIGSSGYLEIAVNGGSACDRTGIARNDIVGREVEVVKPDGLNARN